MPLNLTRWRLAAALALAAALTVTAVLAFHGSGSSPAALGSSSSRTSSTGASASDAAGTTTGASPGGASPNGASPGSTSSPTPPGRTPVAGSPSGSTGGAAPGTSTAGGSPGTQQTGAPATAGPTAPAATPTPPPPAPQPGDLTLPIRAAFYYPWFPQAWNQQGMNPFTKYHPTLGYYSSADLATVQAHIAAMRYGGIQAGIASWWGQGATTDQNLPTLLAAASGTPFRWGIYYEQEGYGDPSVAQITSDLTYIQAHYASNPAFLRLNGRFVVFVYDDAADATNGCAMVDRWKQANASIGAYLVLKVFPGYTGCASQPDGWHQYAPAGATDSQPPWSYSISPGFNKANEAQPRLARNPAAWSADVAAMVQAHPQWQLITTFDEWGEGTAVESAQEWQTSSGYGIYLDALHGT